MDKTFPSQQTARGMHRSEIYRRAKRRYRPAEYRGNIVLFRAIDRVPTQFHTDRCLGWSKIAEGIKVHNVPGGHVTMLKQPHVTALAEQLSAYLTQ